MAPFVEALFDREKRFPHGDCRTDFYSDTFVKKDITRYCPRCGVEGVSHRGPVMGVPNSYVYGCQHCDNFYRIYRMKKSDVENHLERRKRLEENAQRQISEPGSKNSRKEEPLCERAMMVELGLLRCRADENDNLVEEQWEKGRWEEKGRYFD